MLAELMLGLALWVGLIGQYRGPRLPLSAAILLVVLLWVFVILLRLVRGPREPSGIRGWLTTRAARTIILGASVLVVAAMNLPVAVAVAAIMVIQAGLYGYALLVFHRRN